MCQESAPHCFPYNGEHFAITPEIGRKGMCLESLAPSPGCPNPCHCLGLHLIPSVQSQSIPLAPYCGHSSQRGTRLSVTLELQAVKSPQLHQLRFQCFTARGMVAAGYSADTTFPKSLPGQCCSTIFFHNRTRALVFTNHVELPMFKRRKIEMDRQTDRQLCRLESHSQLVSHRREGCRLLFSRLCSTHQKGSEFTLFLLVSFLCGMFFLSYPFKCLLPPN